MKRREAIDKLIRIRQLQDNKSEAHEALGVAIDALAYQAELPEGLEDAAEKYREYREKCGINDPTMLVEIADAYYTGAGWDRAKMMEKAMEGEVVGYDDGTGKFITVLEDLPNDSPYKVHDKVRLIVIPKEDKKDEEDTDID